MDIEVGILGGDNLQPLLDKRGVECNHDILALGFNTQNLLYRTHILGNRGEKDGLRCNVDIEFNRSGSLGKQRSAPDGCKELFHVEVNARVVGIWQQLAVIREIALKTAVDVGNVLVFHHDLVIGYREGNRLLAHGESRDFAEECTGNRRIELAKASNARII